LKYLLQDNHWVWGIPSFSGLINGVGLFSSTNPVASRTVEFWSICFSPNSLQNFVVHCSGLRLLSFSGAGGYTATPTTQAPLVLMLEPSLVMHHFNFQK
jgi:hypothetical protein